MDNLSDCLLVFTILVAEAMMLNTFVIAIYLQTLDW